MTITAIAQMKTVDFRARLKDHSLGQHAEVFGELAASRSNFF
jgi:hypothetical protein